MQLTKKYCMHAVRKDKQRGRKEMIGKIKIGRADVNEAKKKGENTAEVFNSRRGS